MSEAGTGTDYAYVPPFKLVRREPPPKPQPFDCAVCEQRVEPSPWPYDKHERAPICNACARMWGDDPTARYRGSTRGDLRVIQRLSAVTNRLFWEAINGRYAL